MLHAFKVLALMFGILAIVFGSIMFAAAKYFGSGGIFDQHRRDVGTEIVFGVIVAIGIAATSWAVLA